MKSSYVSTVSGRTEGRITGEVAAEVARCLYTASFSPGVYHIEQLFEPLEIIEALDAVLDFNHGGLGTPKRTQKHRLEKGEALKTASL